MAARPSGEHGGGEGVDGGGGDGGGGDSDGGGGGVPGTASIVPKEPRVVVGVELEKARRAGNSRSASGLENPGDLR